MFMTYGTLDQSGKGSAAECGSGPTSKPCCIARGSAALVAQVQAVRTASISIPGGGVGAGSAGRSRRSHRADHAQASAEHSGTAAEIRAEQWPNHWSDRDTRVELVSTRSKKTWLSRGSKAAHGKFTFPIHLIACSRERAVGGCPKESENEDGCDLREGFVRATARGEHDCKVRFR